MKKMLSILSLSVLAVSASNVMAVQTKRDLIAEIGNASAVFFGKNNVITECIDDGPWNTLMSNISAFVAAADSKKTSAEWNKLSDVSNEITNGLRMVYESYIVPKIFDSSKKSTGFDAPLRLISQIKLSDPTIDMAVIRSGIQPLVRNAQNTLDQVKKSLASGKSMFDSGKIKDAREVLENLIIVMQSICDRIAAHYTNLLVAMRTYYSVKREVWNENMGALINISPGALADLRGLDLQK